MADEEQTEDLDVEATETEGLPAFEGTVPVGVVTKLSGSGDTTITGARHIGDRAVLLVEAEVDNVAHDKTKKGLVRIQRFSVLELYELDVDGEGRDLLRAQRTAYRMASDAAKGLAALTFDDTAQPACYVDASGVMLTAQEIAEQRGDRLLVDSQALITVVFEDGGSYFWPDDWQGSGQSLASVGGLMRQPNGEPGERGKVIAWRNAESGDTLDEWTDEDEQTLLRFVEAAAELDEDVAAVQLLEDARRLKGSQSVVEQAAAGEPWHGYDASSAADIRRNIEVLESVDELRRGFAYELAHKDRQTVKVAFEKRLQLFVPKEGGDNAED